MLWEGGANFETPPPMIGKEGLFEPLPPTGARTLNSKTAFYYGYTLDSPGMIMRAPRVGSQYLMGFVDSDKKPYDGGKTYKVTLPPNIPAAAFWSFTLYDNQSRSMLQNATGLPACWQPELSIARRRTGRGRFHHDLFRADQRKAKRGNWIQTVPGKGWFTLLAPLQPARELSSTKEMAPERARAGALRL